MKTEEIVKLLEKDHHILSKNYHDGAGRQFWLRNKDQESVLTLTPFQVSEIQSSINLKREHVVSSDQAFILATKSGHEAWK